MTSSSSTTTPSGAAAGTSSAGGSGGTSAGLTAAGAAAGVPAGPPQTAPPVVAADASAARGLDPTQTMVGTSNGVGLWIAPEGTDGPADLDSPFTAPWRPLGYASDDGPTISGDTTTETITPWQSTSPIRTIITERSQTVQFVMWQLNQDTLGLYFNTDVPDGAGGALQFDVRSDAAGRIHAVAVDARDGLNAFRIVYPRATLDSAGDMQLQKGAMVPLDVTLSALDDAGVLAHVWARAGTGSEPDGLTVTATPQSTEPATAEPEPAA